MNSADALASHLLETILYYAEIQNITISGLIFDFIYYFRVKNMK
jgi:hypothetical protein